MKYGDDWEAWRAYADEWLHEQDKGLEHRLKAIILFLEAYLLGEGLPSVPAFILKAGATLPPLLPAIGKTITSKTKIERNNYIVEFIDWVISKDFSKPNDHGLLVPQFPNPFCKEKKVVSSFESVYNPLPYAYIKELRAILCPDPKLGHFRDWTWAQTQTGQERPRGRGHTRRGDWFDVDSDLIDKNDPDCVWREYLLLPGQQRAIHGKRPRLKKELRVYQMWSPVRVMLLFIKLHLPLRTYQVRMLDSGEADTWRYDNGHFVRNTQHAFVQGNEKAPWKRGVFHRMRSPDTGEWHTGLYINTNKTADINKDVIDRGYVIPWEHPEVSRWLEKLRNWQEKYNPIDRATPWTSLLKKHTGQVKSLQDLKEMGATCFLMRDASAAKPEDRVKPVHCQAHSNLWYRLLKTLEDRVYEREGRLSDGARLRFVKDKREGELESTRTATEFPPHCLRVSLITHYVMVGQVPLPVVSKLLAGHSRLIMTIYYTKITPAVFRKKMAAAEALIDAKEQQQLADFLADAELRQIKDNTVFSDGDAVEAVLIDRNPLGWEQRYIGLCLAGGNTVKSDEKGTIVGCWNGGELIRNKSSGRDRIYGTVPHGPENCIRCRWFITDATYLDALRAHFNNLSYQAQLAANIAIEHEQTVEVLEDVRFACAEAKQPFTRQAELQMANRRHEKQLVEADEYVKDMRACFTLIHRIFNIEQCRVKDDNRHKLVAVGALHDIHHPISLLETQSELFQLSEICQDAEIYPDQADYVRKSPAIEKRSRVLNTALMREGYQPIFMMMDEKMQLVVGNALMRRMAKQVSPEDWRIKGMQCVTGVIETGQSLQKAGLLETGLKALELVWQQPVLRLNELLHTNKRTLEVVHDDTRSEKST
ncbi:MAG: integrase [Candidatus Thiodiazotropha sp. (ex Lucinoma borealis)]|nr:integrase [Candidatus Thiodiazotropha sp. (ex Lucinoma borealis)]